MIWRDGVRRTNEEIVLRDKNTTDSSEMRRRSKIKKLERERDSLCNGRWKEERLVMARLV